MNKLECAFCKKTYPIKNTWSKNYLKVRKYCSRNCYRKDPNKLGIYKVGYIGLKMDKNPTWKGGKRIDERGYIRIAIGNRRWKYEHRLVMEKIIGRPLTRNEDIHHINGDKSDNRIINLMFFPSKHAHSKYHHFLKLFNS